MQKISRSPQSSRASAFTLVELLTVIVIIGVLAALLLPAISRMRKAGATAAETGNLRQIAQAMMAYAGDNGNMLPNNSTAIPGTSVTPNDPPRWTFQEAVERYLGIIWKKNPGSIYNYLGDPIWYSVYAEPYPGFTPLPSYNKTRPTAYGYNPYVNNSNWLGRLSAIPTPASIVILGEVNDVASISTTITPETKSNVSTAYRVSRDGGALYVFCDGHVAALAGDQSETALSKAGKPNIWRWW